MNASGRPPEWESDQTGCGQAPESSLGDATVTDSGVSRRTLRRRARAECGVCRWRSASRWALALGVQHAEQTGHPVIGSYSAVYAYNAEDWRIEPLGPSPEPTSCPDCLPDVVVAVGHHPTCPTWRRMQRESGAW